MTNTRPTNLPQSGEFSFEAMISMKKNQLVTLIREGGIFDSDTLAAFDQSRKPDGTYTIQTGEPALVSNAKSVINILQSLEKLLPAILKPLLEYLQSESSFRSVWPLGKMLAGGIWNAGSISQAYTDIRNLPFYLNQLQSILATLPGIDSTFFPLVAELKNAIGRDIQPALEQIKLLQADTDQPMADSKENIDVVLQSFDLAATGGGHESENAWLPLETGEKSRFESVLINLDNVKNKIQVSLKQWSDKTPDPETGCYAVLEEQNSNTRSLMHAHNSIVIFGSALNRIDQALNFKKIQSMDIFKDLGAAILELEKIDLESIKQTGAEELVRILAGALQKIEPVLVQTVRWLEYAETRLGLKNQVLQKHLQGLCEQYERLAATFGMDIKHRYPYWEERLRIREEGLQQKKLLLEHYIQAETAIKKFRIEPAAPLRDLIHMRDAARQLPSPQTFYLAKCLTALINTRTGMDVLAKDITDMEKRVLESNEKERDAVIKQLKELYQLRDEIRQKLLDIASNPSAPQDFSYQRDNPHLIPEQIPVTSKHLPKASVYDNAYKAANGLVTAAKQEVERMRHWVSEAQEQVLIDRISSQPDESQKGKELARLHDFLQNLSPLSLYTMPVSELHALEEALSKTGSPACTAFQKILASAYRERTMVEEAKIRLQKNVTDTGILAQAREMLVNDRFSDFDGIKKSVCAILEMPLEEMERQLKELKSSWTYYLTGRMVYEYPVIKLIDSKLTDIEIHNQTLQKAGKYQGTHLEDWEAARQAALFALRESRFKLAAPDIPPVVALPAMPAIQGGTSLAAESSEELVSRLARERLGTIRSTLEMTRQQLVSLIEAEYFDPSQTESFKQTRQADATWTILPADSVLHKNIKSLLNIISRFDQLYLLVTQQFDTGSYVAIGANLYKNTGEIKKKFQALLAEFSDLLFYLDEIKSVTSSLAGPEQMAILRQMSQIAAPAVSNMAAWFKMPGLSDVLNINMDEAAQRINNAAVKLKDAANPPAVKEMEPADPEQVEHLRLLNLAIDKVHQYRQEQTNKSPREISEATLANLKKIEQMLTSMKNAMISMIDISQSSNPLAMIPIMTHLILTYRDLQKIDTRELEDVLNIVRNAIGSFQPLFSQLAAHSELAEMRLGLKQGQLTQPVEKLCRMYESLADQFDVHLTDGYPYALTKIKAYTVLLDQESSRLAELHDLITTLQENNFDQLSFADLVRMRNTLILLPPSKNQAVLTPLNKIIADATGLSTLEDRISKTRSGLAAAENKIAKAEDSLNSIRLQLDMLEKNRQFLGEIQAKLTGQALLSMPEIRRLHDIYSDENAITLNEFCNKLAYDKSAVLLFAANAIKSADIQINLMKANITDQEIIINTETKLYKQKQAELSRHENLASELRGKISESGKQGVSGTIFRYDSASNSLKTASVEFDTGPLRDADKAIAIQELQNTRHILDARFSEHSKKLERTILEHETHINNMLNSVDNILAMIEEKYGLKNRSLANMLLSPPPNAADMKLIEHKTHSAYRLNHSQGLLSELVIRHPDASRRARYQRAIESTDDSHAQIKAVAKVASKKSRRLGRLFRRFAKHPSHDDLIYYTSHYLLKDANYRKAYGHDSGSFITPSSSSMIMTSLPEHPSGVRGETLPAPDPQPSLDPAEETKAAKPKIPPTTPVSPQHTAEEEHDNKGKRPQFH
ncbi:hypothetical protein AQUSIP_00860 [Aquicella siphonis]|uniref:Uncharacterized protein n=1 Tax=Aquicella siphonis TaxID=254247 RepID=A0A5E4PDH2_9COXI|nr:hypothetical protein [Aquicella siphonis]VVC74814.1 hypothetical protein AQUSIP_00860 [Aquicella siphonis]